MYYVYEWFVEETGEVIYVGKGTRNRYKVRKHNRFFDDMVTRFNCSSRIVKEFDIEKEAFEYEYQRILELKADGQCVCNISVGGYGGSTNWWNEERKKWYSEHNTMKNQAQRDRMSAENPMKDKATAMKVGATKKRKICVENKIYDSLQAVSDAYNVSPQLFLYWIDRGYTNRKERCYYYGESAKELNVLSHGSTVKKAVLIDGKRYSGIREAASAIGCNSSYLSKALKKGKTIKGHSCSYADSICHDLPRRITEVVVK